MNVSFRPRAVDDIERQAAYLDANASPSIANRFRKSIEHAINQIAEMPGFGVLREVRSNRLKGLHMWIVPEFRNYLIFYLSSEHSIEILRVFHGAQDIDGNLEIED